MNTIEEITAERRKRDSVQKFHLALLRHANRDSKIVFFPGKDKEYEELHNGVFTPLLHSVRLLGVSTRDQTRRNAGTLAFVTKLNQQLNYLNLLERILEKPDPMQLKSEFINKVFENVQNLQASIHDTVSMLEKL